MTDELKQFEETEACENNPLEDFDVGSLDDVKEQTQLLPPADDVKLQIVKADLRSNEDESFRWINLDLLVVDGLDETGSYKGKHTFQMISFYADPAKYTKDYFKNNQHLVDYKKYFVGSEKKAALFSISSGSKPAIVTKEILGKTVFATIRQNKAGDANNIYIKKLAGTEDLV